MTTWTAASDPRCWALGGPGSAWPCCSGSAGTGHPCPAQGPQWAALSEPQPGPLLICGGHRAWGSSCSVSSWLGAKPEGAPTLQASWQAPHCALHSCLHSGELSTPLGVIGTVAPSQFPLSLGLAPWPYQGSREGPVPAEQSRARSGPTPASPPPELGSLRHVCPPTPSSCCFRVCGRWLWIEALGAGCRAALGSLFPFRGVRGESDCGHSDRPGRGRMEQSGLQKDVWAPRERSSRFSMCRLLPWAQTGWEVSQSPDGICLSLSPKALTERCQVQGPARWLLVSHQRPVPAFPAV